MLEVRVHEVSFEAAVSLRRDSLAVRDPDVTPVGLVDCLFKSQPVSLKIPGGKYNRRITRCASA